MSRRSSRSTDLALCVLLTALGATRWSEAQSCCAGGGAYAPARLKAYENAAVGVLLRAADSVGSLDSTGRYFAAPSGALEFGFEQDVVAAYRLSEAAQVGLVIPFQQTLRTAGNHAGFGGGLGDLSLNGRYEIVPTSSDKGPVGFALNASLVAPTGRPPEKARTALAVDATGSGYWQATLSATVEKMLGRWLVAGTLSLSGVLPRQVGDTVQVLGPQVAALIAGGYGFRNGTALMATVGCRATTSVYVNGTSIPGAPVLTTLGLAVGWPINFEWRLQGSVNGDLPVLGRSREVALSASATLLRTF